MQEIFDCGDYNEDGICRSICARWLYVCTKNGGAVTDISELGSKSFIALLWDAAQDDSHIDRNNLLRETKREETTESKPFSPTWMARHLTMGPGKAIMTAWDNSLKRSAGVYSKGMEGHSMATNRIGGSLQFLDPNTSCWQFDNTLEFYDFLPGYINAGTGGPDWFTGYPELTRYQGIVYKYA